MMTHLTPISELDAPASGGVADRAFDRPWWDYRQLVHWVCVRDRKQLEHAEDQALTQSTLDNAAMMIWSKLSTQARARLPKTRYAAEKDILNQLQRGALTASGHENNSGDRKVIPTERWAAAEICWAGPQSGGLFARSSADSVRWHQLEFKREEVLKLWPIALSSAPDGGFVDDKALREWTVPYLDRHKNDAKHPPINEIVRAAQEYFHPAIIENARGRIARIRKPPEWNKRGRKPGARHSAE
jgi:hypothetical protein